MTTPLKITVSLLTLLGLACGSVVREDDGSGGDGAAPSTASAGPLPVFETCAEWTKALCPEATPGDCLAEYDETYYQERGCFEEAKALWQCGYEFRCGEPPPVDPDKCCGPGCPVTDPRLKALQVCLEDFLAMTSSSSSTGGGD